MNSELIKDRLMELPKPVKCALCDQVSFKHSGYSYRLNSSDTTVVFGICSNCDIKIVDFEEVWMINGERHLG